jgi:hypothetical protein
MTGLQDAEPTYAPPFSPIRDPILTAVSVPEELAGV